MSKLGDFIAAFKKNSAAPEEKVKQKEQSVQAKEAKGIESAGTQGNAGENEKRKTEGGVNNQAAEFRGRTINRKLVFAVSGICVAAFLVSFLSFSQNGQKPRQQDARLETSEHASVSDLKYSSLSQKDKLVAAGRNPNQAQSAVGANTQGAGKAASPQRQAAIPQPSAPSYTANGGNNATIARVQSEEAQVKKEAKAQADAYSAAIYFSLAANPATASETVTSSGNSIASGAASTMATRQTPVENALYAGTLLPAMLMSGVSSDLGGQLMAQITTDIYDSLHGDTLLIPMGSRLIGQYDAGAENGQSRVSVKWSMLILPDGSSYNIDGKLTSADGAGYPGIPGDVNEHEGKILTGGALSSAIAAFGSIAVGNTGSGDDESAGRLAMEGAQANLLNSASAMFNKNLNIKPTITIAPGTAFTVQVNQTMVLEPYW